MRRHQQLEVLLLDQLIDLADAELLLALITLPFFVVIIFIQYLDCINILYRLQVLAPLHPDLNRSEEFPLQLRVELLIVRLRCIHRHYEILLLFKAVRSHLLPLLTKPPSPLSHALLIRKIRY